MLDKAETKTVYAYDNTGLYSGAKILNYTDHSPVSGAWQIPAGCTETIPPAAKDNYDIIWDGTEWVYKEQAKVTNNQNDESTNTIGSVKEPVEPSFPDRLAAVEDALNSRLME